MDIWIIFVIILSLLMSFSIGSNDAANGLATSYGSKALSLKKLVIIGSISEFVGAMFCANRVAATLSADIIPTLNFINPSEQRIMMFSVCLASFVFIMSSSFFGMPISGTHTVVGALLGAGMIAVGPKNVSWLKLGHIALSWIISPLIACTLSFGLMFIVCSLTLNTKHLLFRHRIFYLQLISAVSFTVISVIIYGLIDKKDKYVYIVSILAFICGMISVRVLLLFKLRVNSSSTFESDSYQWRKYLLVAILAPWETEFIEKLCMVYEIIDFNSNSK